MTHMSSLVTNPLHCLIERPNAAVAVASCLHAVLMNYSKTCVSLKMCELYDFICVVEIYFTPSQSDATYC